MQVMPMRTILAVVFLAALCNAIGEEPLGGVNITLPYSELSSLLKAFDGLIKSAEKAEGTKSPVNFTVLSSKVALTLKETSAQGTLTFDVQAFLEEPQLIPLVNNAVSIDRVEGEDANIVLKDGFYWLLIEGRKRQRVTLHIAWPGKVEDNSIFFECNITPAVISALEISPLPNGQTVEILGAILTEKPGIWRLSQLGKLDIHFKKEQSEPPGTVIPMPAIVHEATSSMRMVRDGTFFNATVWKIQHNSSLTWRIRPGKGFQVVSCLVEGNPSIPVLVDEETLEIRVPEHASTVELSYTGKTASFEPVRGNFSIALPSTELLVERLDWSLSLPDTFGPIAVEGNCEFLSGNSQNELLLRKELCRDEAPTVRVFYQKLETNK